MLAGFSHFQIYRAHLSEELRWLYDRILAPVRDHLRTKTVVLVPHGPLHYLPFAALYDGARSLVESYLLIALPSASAIARPRQDVGAPAPPLVLAQPIAKGLRPLINAEAEAETIAQLLGTTARTGEAALESLVALRPSPRIIHIAAHGLLDAKNPLFSRVFLAPDHRADGRLEVHEIMAMDLGQTELVVLSACSTELGRVGEGDDVVGPSRAFLGAGTGGVLASLWTVDDEASTLQMTTFYRSLAEGLPIAVALANAQNETKRAYPHPFYWAGFVLTTLPNIEQKGARPAK